MVREFNNWISAIIAAVFFSVIISGCAISPESTSKGPAITDPNGHGLGALPEDPVKYQNKLITRSGISRKFYAVSAAALPTSIDLAHKMPPVKSQGGQGSCVGWATGYYAKTYQESLEEKWNITLEGNQFSPAWVYNQINFGYDSGAYVSDALDLIVKKGCDTWTGFPYNEADCLTKPSEASFNFSLHYKAYQYFTLPSDINTIKSILFNSNVVVMRLEIYPDFDTISPENPIYNDNTGSTRGGHALCIVGYDDTKKAFKFVNSWGDSWGTWKNDNDHSQGKGYGWISYDCVTDIVPVGFYAWVLYDANNIKDSQIIPVPAKVEAESFASMKNILVEACNEGGQSIRLDSTNDWVEYIVNNTVADDYYNIVFRASTPALNGYIYANVDGDDQQLCSIYNTGSWQTWDTFTKLIYLKKGIRRLRFYVSNDGYSLNWFKIQGLNESSSSSSSSSIISSSSIMSSSSSSSSPAIILPGKIEAENYNAMSGIQTEVCSEGGFDVGWIDASDWMDYNVNILQSGSYIVEFRVASINTTGALDMIVNGLTVCSKDIPNTGGWQTWTTITANVSLNAGSQKIRLYARGASFNINWINVKTQTSSSSSVISSSSSVKSSSSKSSVMSSSIPSSLSSSKSSSSSVSSTIRSSSSVTSTSGGIKILSYSGSLKTSDNQLYPRFKVVNTGTSTINLSDVKVRYYYTADGTQVQTYYCDYTTAGTANVTGVVNLLATVKPTADSYVEIGFKAGAGTLAPGAQLEVQGRVAKSDWSNYNQSNDYSFDAIDITYTDWNKVTGYLGGTLVYGVVP